MEKVRFPGLVDSIGGSGIKSNITNPIQQEPQIPSTSYQPSAYTSVDGMERKDGSIGTLKIPSLNINMKVWEGETNTSMAKGLGHYSSTSGWDGNIGVCGHNRGAKYTNKAIAIRLDDAYTDKDGVSYNNYGTYLMRKYYASPEAFRNSYRFLHEISPGFFFKVTNGIGSMAYVTNAQLNIYFRSQINGKDSVTSTSLASTEEVLQTTTFSNDNNLLASLAAQTGCSYLKSPAGLFTEVTLPVDEIMRGHENDTLNTAKVTFPRINNTVSSDFLLSAPTTVLILPLDELHTFFAENRIPDYKTSFTAAYSATVNGYTFNNISGLVNYMIKKRRAGQVDANWNKAVLVPISLATTTITGSSGTKITRVTKCSHDMSLSSTRLVGGPNNANQPILLSVIHSTFNGR